MKCSECRFTLPCFGGQFGFNQAKGIDTALCMKCGRLSIILPERPMVIWSFFCELRPLTESLVETFLTSDPSVFTLSRGNVLTSDTKARSTKMVLLKSAFSQQQYNVAQSLILCHCHICRSRAPAHNRCVRDLETISKKHPDGEVVQLMGKEAKHRRKKRRRRKWEEERAKRAENVTNKK